MGFLVLVVMVVVVFFHLVLLPFPLVLSAWVLLLLSSITSAWYPGLSQTLLSSPIETTASLQIVWFPTEHLPHMHWDLHNAKASTLFVVKNVGERFFSPLCYIPLPKLDARDIFLLKVLLEQLFSFYFVSSFLVP